MAVKLFIATVLLCVVLVKSNSDCVRNKNIMPDYVRVKRAKYYSSPPQRFYKRPPPFGYPSKSVYSYTPPPSYMDEEESPPSYRPVKVNKRPNSEGLGDEDINNIIKYLSKQDLDKIIEFAGENDKNKGSQFEKYSGEYHNTKEESKIYKTTQELDQKFSLNGPYISNDNKAYDSTLNNQYVKDIEPKIVTNPFINNIDVSTPLDTEESMQSSKVSFLNGYINKELNGIPDYSSGNIFTDSKTMLEEPLPRPLNLREEGDFDASFSNNVPTVVKAESSNSYKIVNFGDLPLMDYNSKLHTVSSYHVPHYTVTTPKKISSQSYSSSSTSSKSPELEPAPPLSAAKEQSDAHLKAIKIWTHRSKGTAYTLHNDGTLSLEIPSRRKPYGHP